MQKKLIALAVAGLASAGAFAQSNVTVYGVADMYVGSFKTDGLERSTKVESGGLAGSRIGFKGVEDLGNGLKALFTAEYALTLDNNSGIGDASVGSTQARQQFVGLTGGFGTAVAGRLQTTAYDWQVKNDVLAGTAIDPLNAVQNKSFLIGSGSGALAARASNAIAYISPSFGGVTVALNRAYLTEEKGVSGTKENDIANLVSVSYDNGPANVGLVWAQDRNEELNYKITDWALGGGYDFGVAKLKATYQQSKIENAETNRAWSLGVGVPVSAAGTVIASYAQGKLKMNDYSAAAPVALADQNKVKSWTLAYTHALSKRTTAYAGYHQVSRDDAIAVKDTDAGADSKAFVAGINHKF